MKNFLQWAEDRKLELPVVKDGQEGEKATAENTKRTGLSANYPDAYVRSQYPDNYFTPKMADAPIKLQAKPRKGGADTAAN